MTNIEPWDLYAAAACHSLITLCEDPNSVSMNIFADNSARFADHLRKERNKRFGEKPKKTPEGYAASIDSLIAKMFVSSDFGRQDFIKLLTDILKEAMGVE